MNHAIARKKKKHGALVEAHSCHVVSSELGIASHPETQSPRPTDSIDKKKEIPDLSIPIRGAGYQSPRPTRVPTLETARAYNRRKVDRPI